jgi:hypothetical protein
MDEGFLMALAWQLPTGLQMIEGVSHEWLGNKEGTWVGGKSTF